MAVNNLRLNKKDIDKFVLYGGRKAKTAQAVINELEEKPDYIINAGHFDNSKKSYNDILNKLIDDKQKKIEQVNTEKKTISKSENKIKDGTPKAAMFVSKVFTPPIPLPKITPQRSASS